MKRDVAARVFGAIPGHPAGSLYPSRGALSRSGVHRPLRAGISGSAPQGADSIVLSGGYEDDRDDGDVIIYTGQGGRDPRSGRQRSHQMLLRGSLALSRSRLLGLPVRVVRGSALGLAYARERPRVGLRAGARLPLRRPLPGQQRVERAGPRRVSGLALPVGKDS